MTLPLRLQGTVCYWRDDKGFGFVITDHKERLFFISAILNKLRPDARNKVTGLALSLVLTNNNAIMPSHYNLKKVP